MFSKITLQLFLSLLYHKNLCKQTSISWVILSLSTKQIGNVTEIMILEIITTYFLKNNFFILNFQTHS